MDLSIIIVNYNVKYFLEQAIDSALQAIKNLHAEVIVVDNNSTDNSVEFIRTRFPSVTIIANTKNVGFSAANNQGYAASTGKYVLLLNPDTVVQEDTFTRCISFMDQHPEAGALGVKMLDGRGNFLPESKRGFPNPEVAFYKAFGLAALFPQSKIFGKYHLGYLHENSIHEVDVLAGAFMFIRRSVLEKTGLLDEAFFMYGEDIDLSYRIVKAGYKNYYFPQAPIIHYKGESTKKGSLNYVRMFYNAMKIFARKHFSGSNAGAFILLINIAIYFRAMLALLGRFTKRMAWPIADVFIALVSMLLVKEYWEYYIRYIEGGKYPAELLYFNIPAYTIIWVGALFFSGVYDRNTNTNRILRGVFWGTVIIAALYGFLPENLRFSRGMIVAGAGLVTILLLTSRYISHFIQYKNFHFGQKKNKRILIIGNQEEAERVYQLLNPFFLSSNIIGYLHVSESKTADSLGSVEQLPQLMPVFNPGEIIFCAKDTGYSKIVSTISVLPDICDFKILSGNSNVFVGSNSKDTAGDILSAESEMLIAMEFSRRNKRLFDISVALILLFTTPLHIWFFTHKLQYLQNIWGVFSGKFTWVSYNTLQQIQPDLPFLKPGIIAPADVSYKGFSDITVIQKINFLYAREYTLRDDLQVIVKGYRSLDNKMTLT